MDVRPAFKGTVTPPAKPSAPNATTGPEESASGSVNSDQLNQGPQEGRSHSSNYPTPPGVEMSETFPGIVKPLAEELVFEWEAPSRPFRRRKRQYYTTIATIVILLCLILFFAGQFLPIAVIIAVAFLAYVMSSVPPHNIINQITTYGIRIESQLFYWEELGRFWYEDRYGQRLLLIEVVRFPNRLTLVVERMEEKVLTSILSEVLLQQKPQPTLYEKIAHWMQQKLPLEIEGKHAKEPTSVQTTNNSAQPTPKSSTSSQSQAKT